MYSLFIPCGRLVIQLASLRTSSLAKRLAAKCSFVFWNTIKSTVPGPDCTEDALRCLNGIAHAARLVFARQYAYVYCRATEQFHARASLFGKIAYDLIGLQKMNNTSHLTVVGFSFGTAMATAISALTMWQGPTCNYVRQLFNITLNTRNNDLLQQNKCKDCMCKHSILSGWPSYFVLAYIYERFMARPQYRRPNWSPSPCGEPA